VLVSVEEYQRLKKRDRRVFAIEDISSGQLAAIEAARVPEQYKHLDAELKDWKP
jgi:hypothetical protein